MDVEMVCGSKESAQCIHPMKGRIRLDKTLDKVSEDRAGFRWKNPAGSLSLSLYNILNLPWISKWPYSKALAWCRRSFQLFRIRLYIYIYLRLISRVYTYVYAYIIYIHMYLLPCTIGSGTTKSSCSLLRLVAPAAMISVRWWFRNPAIITCNVCWNPGKRVFDKLNYQAKLVSRISEPSTVLLA